MIGMLTIEVHLFDASKEAAFLAAVRRDPRVLSVELISAEEGS